MYLKSIEIHGFKSFANKLVFQFHNGITGIVGPNGSGKSNVADAVRWVLGEQSAKQLRGSSMQDVIFAGTEARKPLGYASVSITFDNRDHQLAVSYDEVTVTRRVYRSGESEYMLNGTQVRLKDINELFYDTGIGKEGYSIIGQGQIDKILSGRPEERRELFDEAAGIVKFKRRKTAAQKKLEDEKQNLVRINDILSELTRQLGPMERQAATAKIYLEKRELLKKSEIQLFLTETVRLKRELDEAEQQYALAEGQLNEAKASYEQAKAACEMLEQELGRLDGALQQDRERFSEIQVEKQRLVGQIDLMGEQINTAKTNDAHFRSGLEAAVQALEEHGAQEEQARTELDAVAEKIRGMAGEEQRASVRLQEIREEIARITGIVEENKEEMIRLLNGRASLKAGSQRFDTMLEQVDIRRARLSQQLLQMKSEEALWQEQIDRGQEEERQVTERIDVLNVKSDEAGALLADCQQKLADCNRRLEQEQVEYHRESSRLESLKNIAERYDGYGSSIRRVMEQRDRMPGIRGVVADLIRTGRKYETAVETALGGSIQNIVTDTEETAKAMIAFLKKNKYGRATFLPLTGISARGGSVNAQALGEPGVLGLASSLVETEPEYRQLADYLLGRTIVAETIDHAIALGRKFRHSLRIVTLEGELLSPGGSMTGGAFKNSGNLLGRRREIEDLGRQVRNRGAVLKKLQQENDGLRRKRNGLRDEIVALKDQLQEEYLLQNTARMKLQELSDKKEQAVSGREKLRREAAEIEQQIREIQAGQTGQQEELRRSEEMERQIEEASANNRQLLEQKRLEEQTALEAVEDARMKLAGMRQKESYVRQDLERIAAEQERLRREKLETEEKIAGAARQIVLKQQEIEQTRQAVADASLQWEEKKKEIEALEAEREQKNHSRKMQSRKREELSEQMGLLDRECYRLNARKEKLSEQRDGQINYMWETYSLTYTAALEQREETGRPLPELKKTIAELKTEIRGLGSVNVNAVEEYRELSQRHSFLSTQQEDILKAEQALLKIIRELDEGMRTQFAEQFARIRSEFDRAFRELFGGGKGTLELVEEEDILEAGIRIIAQPPGKKLQNMMQMSGGEKALTAIALLFAIQNLKPSPFCLLDEIEAALDESNVDRYARYLHKLTKHTQFIIITHRRGTMAAADRLYGITMQEKGVSALVSVNLIEQDLDE